MKYMISVALFCVLSATVVQAQTFGNPAGLSPDTPGMEAAKPAPDHGNVQDRLFVRQATLGGYAEVEFGKLAAQKGASDAVQSFARRMVEDHSKSNDQLARAGRGLNPNTPRELDAEHHTIRGQLDGLSGKDFDVRYLTSQIQDHQKTVNLLLWQMSYGQNEALKKYATDTLPVVMEHLEMAQRHYAEVTGSLPRF